MRSPTDREQIDHLTAEVARLEEIIRGLTGARDPRVPGLTRAQSRIIRTLERAGGRLVSKDALMDALYWDRGGDEPGEGILGVLICQIRKRRPDIGARIVSGWGQGWGLLPEARAAEER